MQFRVYGFENIRAAITLSRSKYSPHQGQREIDRRLCAEARDLNNQHYRARMAGIDPDARLSRRGRIIAQA